MDSKRQLLETWELAERLREKLNSLDKLRPNRRQQAAISSVQAQYRWWRCSNLGELLNEFGIPPEDRH